MFVAWVLLVLLAVAAFMGFRTLIRTGGDVPSSHRWEMLAGLLLVVMIVGLLLVFLVAHSSGGPLLRATLPWAALATCGAYSVSRVQAWRERNHTRRYRRELRLSPRRRIMAPILAVTLLWVGLLPLAFATAVLLVATGHQDPSYGFDHLGMNMFKAWAAVGLAGTWGLWELQKFRGRREDRRLADEDQRASGSGGEAGSAGTPGGGGGGPEGGSHSAPTARDSSTDDAGTRDNVADVDENDDGSGQVELAQPATR